jgi:hypothetical protein
MGGWERLCCLTLVARVEALVAVQRAAALMQHRQLLPLQLQRRCLAGISYCRLLLAVGQGPMQAAAAARSSCCSSQVFKCSAADAALSWLGIALAQCLALCLAQCSSSLPVAWRLGRPATPYSSSSSSSSMSTCSAPACMQR